MYTPLDLHWTLDVMLLASHFSWMQIHLDAKRREMQVLEHNRKYRRFVSTVMIVISLKRWVSKARLRHWERVNAGITNSLDLVLYNRPKGEADWRMSKAGRKNSLISRNVVLRNPKRAEGMLLRASVTESDTEDSLTLHTHVYSSGARTEATFKQPDWAAFNPASLDSMTQSEKVQLADTKDCSIHRLH
jgi:hypothetical protein